jgi:hypothetical protein
VVIEFRLAGDHAGLRFGRVSWWVGAIKIPFRWWPAAGLMESAVQEPGRCRAGTVQALLSGARLRRFWLITLVVSRARVRRQALRRLAVRAGGGAAAAARRPAWSRL